MKLFRTFLTIVGIPEFCNYYLICLIGTSDMSDPTQMGEPNPRPSWLGVIKVYYSPLRLTSRGATLVLYWTVLADSSSKPISTVTNVFCDATGFA